jgi:hypothetical protein
MLTPRSWHRNRSALPVLHSVCWLCGTDSSSCLLVNKLRLEADTSQIRVPLPGVTAPLYCKQQNIEVHLVVQDVFLSFCFSCVFLQSLCVLRWHSRSCSDMASSLHRLVPEGGFCKFIIIKLY